MRLPSRSSVKFRAIRMDVVAFEVFNALNAAVIGATLSLSGMLIGGTP
jgi:hypothetical protein